MLTCTSNSHSLIVIVGIKFLNLFCYASSPHKSILFIIFKVGILLPLGLSLGLTIFSLDLHAKHSASLCLRNLSLIQQICLTLATSLVVTWLLIQTLLTPLAHANWSSCAWFGLILSLLLISFLLVCGSVIKIRRNANGRWCVHYFFNCQRIALFDLLLLLRLHDNDLWFIAIQIILVVLSLPTCSSYLAFLNYLVVRIPGHLIFAVFIWILNKWLPLLHVLRQIRWKTTRIPLACQVVVWRRIRTVVLVCAATKYLITKFAKHVILFVSYLN